MFHVGFVRHDNQLLGIRWFLIGMDRNYRGIDENYRKINLD